MYPANLHAASENAFHANDKLAHAFLRRHESVTYLSDGVHAYAITPTVIYCVDLTTKKQVSCPSILANLMREHVNQYGYELQLQG